MARDKEVENEEVVKDENLEEVEENENQEETSDEVEETLNKLLRLQADFNNYKKRTEKEKENLVSYGVEKIACQLFPILDNFERALESQEDKEDGFYKGVEMIYNQLIESLANNNIEEIDALHQAFDPNYHYAVVMEESEDHDEGTIIQVLQKGYILKDKVIRPSMVMVSK